MDFTFELAAPADDAALRHLLATNAMPGRLTVTFEREPNYFLGCSTMGRCYQVIVGRPHASEEIAAVICRASTPRFINGAEREIGYIGQLRVAEQYRGRWVLSQGLDFVRDLHADGRVPIYLAAISDENHVARGVLVDHRRPHFPALREVAHLHTLGLIVRRPKPPLPAPYRLLRGAPAMLGEIVAFLRREGAAKQFFPAYAETDFTAEGTQLTRGFDVRDFIVARGGGEIVGVVGLWDQSGYKQTVVQSYAGSMQKLRPLYNLGLRGIGAQPLPRPGEHLRSAYVSFICVAGNDPGIFAGLLRAIYNLAAERRYAHLLVGLAERDPLLPVAQAYMNITYHSRLYTVAWDDGAETHAAIDDRVPYIEIAAL